MLSVMDLIILDQLEQEEKERKTKQDIINIIYQDWDQNDLDHFLINNPQLDPSLSIKEIKNMLIEGNKNLFSYSEYNSLKKYIDNIIERRK